MTSKVVPSRCKCDVGYMPEDSSTMAPFLAPFTAACFLASAVVLSGLRAFVASGKGSPSAGATPSAGAASGLFVWAAAAAFWVSFRCLFERTPSFAVHFVYIQNSNNNYITFKTYTANTSLEHFSAEVTVD